MKIVIVNGSARKGNTLAVIEAFSDGAKEKMKLKSFRVINLTSVSVKDKNLEIVYN